MENLTDLLGQSMVAERQREAQRLRRRIRGKRSSQGLRAGFASRLATLALCIDRDAASGSLSGPSGRAAVGGSGSRC